MYEIKGTTQEGYILNLRSTHMSGAGTILMTEQKETQLQGNGDLAEHTLDCLSRDEDEQDLCRKSQYMEQEADIVTAMDPT